ncbi:MAG: 2,3-diphosphoglycerate-dependent phosphoglycerate mutase [Bacteroidetes bacterium]|nr:2,3-diphosphoglycerate-dependent phosphoglycerate mutase [Bacteroidota bacterium]MBX7047051.1 2,3-diphosphoglycerate-dependent phosphoglycerate mutase [Ignavibacteria bacterium]
MPNLVLVRHGQSLWNLENKFTGWIDIDLSTKGEDEAKESGRKLANFEFDIAFTSALTRAQRTLSIILEENKKLVTPIVKDQALNERMYGDLQGMNKDECRAKFGEDQVKIWRRSYDIPPPNGESLKDTADRVLPYYHDKIEPLLRDGQNILIVAHGNSLRALIMYLEKMTPAQILEFEIPTGTPRLYTLDKNLNVLEVIYL